MEVAIVGAGMAGLAAADALVHEGASVTVYDKSRGLGGRLATRRAGPWRIDHGAPWVDARYAAFGAHLRRAEAAGHAAEAAPGRMIGLPTMSGLVAPLANGAAVHHEVEIATVRIASGHVELKDTDDRAHGPFARAIVAIPAPQAARVVDLPGTSVLREVRMVPVWTLLAAWRDGTPATARDDVVDLAVPMAGRPGREDQAGAVALHADPDWSAENLEHDKAAMAERLLARIAPDGPDPDYVAAHRWRFARAATPLGDPYLALADGLVLLGGDWALGDRAEHAWLSGRAMAGGILGTQ